jgi:hypothetical protein
MKLLNVTLAFSTIAWASSASDAASAGAGVTTHADKATAAARAAQNTFLDTLMHSFLFMSFTLFF